MSKIKIAGIAIASCVCIAVVGYNWTHSDSELAFDSAVWKKGEPNKVRFRMYHDLMNTHKLVGMRRTEVEKLLGEPENYGNTFPKGDYVYFLGMKKTLIFDDFGYLMHVKFQDGVVTEVVLID